MLNLSDYTFCVTGGAGFLGRHIERALAARGVPAQAIFVPERRNYDLRSEAAVQRMYDDAQCDIVIHLAAVVGGIGANRTHPGRFIYDNLAMGLNVIEEGRRRKIRKFVQVGTVCSYPKFCSVPFRETELWSGYPEETNAPYGIAKRALFALLDAYYQEYGMRSAALLPTNLFGPGDDFDEASSHVIPALIRRMEHARKHGDASVTCWGTGAASREFLYVADAAEAIVRATECVDVPSPINLGTGQEITIRSLAEKVAAHCGYDGQLCWDATHPEGQPRRCLDVSRAKNELDWTATTTLDAGLPATIAWFRSQWPSP
jgi:GDP-L-fucose synthase